MRLCITGELLPKVAQRRAPRSTRSSIHRAICAAIGAATCSIVSLGCGDAAPIAVAPPAGAEQRTTASSAPSPVMSVEHVERLSVIYADALRAAGGDRAAGFPYELAEEYADRLAQSYIADPSSDHAHVILQLLREMRTPRAWPAFAVALDWRPEQTEEHAIIAAFALGAADFSSVDASTRASALARALERVEGRRTMDDRLRIALISALRRLDHPTSAAALERVMSRADPAQSFLINRIAAEALGRLTDLPSIPSLVLALFRFAPDDPRMRINDLAAIALVQRGGHALAPALALLRGENAEALAIARRYVESMSAIDAAAAARMTPESIVRAEAVYLLGQLGGPQSLEPLLAETRVSDDERRVLAAGALIRLVGLTSADAARVREAVERVYRASRDERGRLFLLAAIQHSHDPGYLPLLLGIAQRSGAGSDRAVAAYRAAVRLAGPREAVALRRIASRARRGSRLHFVESEPALEAVERCDEDVACWRELLSAGRPLVAAQAAAALARLRERESSPPGTPSGAAVHSLDTGEGERRPEMRAAELGRAREGARQPTMSDVVPVLLAQLDSPHVPLRVEVLYALDRICVATCEEVITAIDALRDREEGRRSWHEVSSLALEVRARQVARRC